MQVLLIQPHVYVNLRSIAIANRFTDPYEFDPKRFSLEHKEDVLYKNWLLFGASAHQSDQIECSL
jgi:cytochrome P450